MENERNANGIRNAISISVERDIVAQRTVFIASYHIQARCHVADDDGELLNSEQMMNAIRQNLIHSIEEHIHTDLLADAGTARINITHPAITVYNLPHQYLLNKSVLLIHPKNLIPLYHRVGTLAHVFETS
jgi:hypothetical protein